jgi:hypothetical protein
VRTLPILRDEVCGEACSLGQVSRLNCKHGVIIMTRLMICQDFYPHRLNRNVTSTHLPSECPEWCC